MPGLDPGIHQTSGEFFSKKMDGRVKPGHDGGGSALPLPLRERVGVRGLQSRVTTVPLTRIALDVRSDLSRKGRGEERAGCLTFE